MDKMLPKSGAGCISKRKPTFIGRLSSCFKSVIPIFNPSGSHNYISYLLFYQKTNSVSKYATIVETVTQINPGIMNEWLSRYLPITVVPERSKLTVAMSDG